MSDLNKEVLNGPLARLAEETGLAIAITDAASREVAAFNNNSICRSLNPGSEYSPACAAFCGKVFERCVETGKGAAYECHAGLQCIAVPVRSSDPPVVAIVGRTFLKAENYRRATERSITGDWQQHSSAELFANVLLTASRQTIEQTARKVASSDTSAIPDLSRSSASTAEPPAPEQMVTPVEDTHEAPGSFEASRAWRSFFGSLLKMDYPSAVTSTMEFLANEHELSALIWLERRGKVFDTIAGFGEMHGRRIKLGIGPDDERLVDAMNKETALELGERAGSESRAGRSMVLFPLGVDSTVAAALAVLGEIDEERQRQISRTCISVGPQLEILRLRREVDHRERIGSAVRRVGEAVRNIDAEDFWLTITQTAAEALDAERASLMVYDQRNEDLVLKSMVGAGKLSGKIPAPRVAHRVHERGQPVIVPDAEEAGLPPLPERRYRSGAFMSSPLILGGRTLGVMNFTDRVGGASFDRTSLEVFLAMAPQLAVAIDRATLKEKAGEFEQLSVTDPLTGLLNRRYIEARLTEEIKRSNRHGFPMSFMMLDVDKFKSYNDQFGHPAGDVALKIVGSVIRETLRSADVAARMGGEEFAILLPQTTVEEAVNIGERIRQNIENTRFPHRAVTASIGIASCSAELCISADLISAADQALYEAKRRGRNRVLSFESFVMERAQ